MIENDPCWRDDLSAIPARERRLARFALGLFFSDARLRERLEDTDLQRVLWELTQGLLHPCRSLWPGIWSTWRH